jgi:cellulose synthase/poly-beta-1,6-N-acetylglucosamine synthase-like glycosyltransferase
MFEIAFLVILCGYFIQIVSVMLGARKRFPRLAESELPTATVIVAARNEEQNILRCLESLDKLEYPEGKLEIVIVDDKSTDRTGELVEQFIEGKPRFKKIISAEEFGSLKGKTNALANAIAITKGEVILTTDADCAVPPSWVKAIASYYTKDVAIVNGFTHQQFSNAFSGMQNLDFIFLLSIGCGTMNLKRPLSCIGNNMSYLRKAYTEVGGYENIPFSVTEDFNLLSAIKKLGTYKIIFPLIKESLVESMPCTSVKTLTRQKKRWVVGGLKLPLYGYVIGINGWLASLAMVVTPFLFTPAAGWFLFTKVLLDMILLYTITTELSIAESMKFFWAFELYYIFYVLTAPLLVVPNRRVVWKDRTY